MHKGLNAYICKQNVCYDAQFALKRPTIQISGSLGSGSSVHGCTLHTGQGQGKFPVVPVGGAVVCDLFPLRVTRGQLLQAAQP